MAKNAPTTAKVFRNGRNQAIRIPVELSFDSDTVTIERHGEALIVRPVHPMGWERFLADDSLVLPDDFELGEDPPPQDRDLF